ncbi:MAG TPA: hypothetical protein VMW74_01125 [Nitrosopumilaceae archaeon]|nr:hypothetical protein [Nitrosopumilaceae archaeon]
MNQAVLIGIIAVTFVAGIGTAYGGVIPTITLDGNAVVTGDTTLLGGLTCTDCVDSADIVDGTIAIADLAPSALGTNFNQIQKEVIKSGLANNNKIECTSNKDFLVHVYVFLSPGASYNVKFEALGGTVNDTITNPGASGIVNSFTLSGAPGEKVTVSTVSIPHMQGMISLQTDSDATASCVDVI